MAEKEVRLEVRLKAEDADKLRFLVEKWKLENTSQAVRRMIDLVATQEGYQKPVPQADGANQS